MAAPPPTPRPGCPATASLVSAIVAAVLASGGVGWLLLVAPWARPTAGGSDSEALGVSPEPRVAALDNAKFLLVTLVVWDHVLALSGFGFESGPYSAVTKAVRFHMPLFCMISGAMSRKPLTKERLLNMFISNLSASLISPNSWYVKCLTSWRLASRLLCALPLIVQASIIFTLGMASAYSKKISEMDRAVAMLPYFWLGQQLDWDCCRRWHLKRMVGVGIGWAAFLVFVSLYIVFEPEFDLVVRAVDTYFPALPWTSMRSLLSSDCPQDKGFLAARYLVGLALRAAQGLLFFLFCVPKGRTWFTDMGAHTLYPFLLHPLPLVALNLPLALWLRSRGVEQWYWRYEQAGGQVVVVPQVPELSLKGCAWAMGHLLYSFVLTWLLSTRRCRKLTAWLVEPWWVLCRRKPQAPSKKE